MTRKYFIIMCGLLVLLGNAQIVAQETKEQNTEEVQNLTDQYKQLYSKSESYNNYKVIKNTTLNTFWKSVEDSMAIYHSQIRTLGTEINALNETNSSMQKRIDQLESELEQAVARTNSLSFLGIRINKNVYNVIVWSIIAGLAAVTFFAFSGFLRSRNLSATSKKEFRELSDEFDAFRKTSHANKVKLGRELQNERNRVEELKENLATSGSKISNGRSKATSNM